MGSRRVVRWGVVTSLILTIGGNDAWCQGAVSDGNLPSNEFMVAVSPEKAELRWWGAIFVATSVVETGDRLVWSKQPDTSRTWDITSPERCYVVLTDQFFNMPVDTPARVPFGKVMLFSEKTRDVVAERGEVFWDAVNIVVQSVDGTNRSLGPVVCIYDGMPSPMVSVTYTNVVPPTETYHVDVTFATRMCRKFRGGTPEVFAVQRAKASCAIQNRLPKDGVLWTTCEKIRTSEATRKNETLIQATIYAKEKTGTVPVSVGENGKTIGLLTVWLVVGAEDVDLDRIIVRRVFPEPEEERSFDLKKTTQNQETTSH